MKLRLFILFLTIALLGVSQPAIGQHSGTLRILVLSGRNGNPLIGANVQLTPAAEGEEVTELLYGASTNANGLVEFDNLSFGKYKVKISYIGYKTFSKVLIVNDLDIRLLKITLKPQTEKLEKLVVEAQRETETGGVGMYTITPREISHVPSPGLSGSLVTYLQTLPGVVTSGDRGGQLYIRGGTPTQNRILIDNLPIVKPFHISNLFTAIPGNMVESAKLYAGGFGAKYYAATSAVLDITLTPGNMRFHETGVTLGTHIASVTVEGPIKKNFSSFLISARKSLIDFASSYLGVEKNTIDFYDIAARLTIRPENYTCNLTAIHTYDQGKINPALNIGLSWQNTVIGASCLGYGGGYKHPAEFTIGYSRYRNSETRFGHNGQYSTKNQLFFKVNHGFERFGLTFDYGFGINIRSYKAKIAKRFTDVQSFDVNDANIHGFISSELRIGKYVALKPSLGSQVTENFMTIEPRMRAAFYPAGTKQYEISLAGGLYYQSDAGITDNRDAGSVFTVIKPVTDAKSFLPSAVHALIGFEANVNDFKISLGNYIIKRKNIPIAKWTPMPTININTALANGISYGFDVRAIYNNPPFYFSLSYGWAKTKYEAATETLGAWVGGKIFDYYPPHDRRHKINFVGSYTFSDYIVSTSWEFGSGKPYTRVFGFDLALNFPIASFPLEMPIEYPGTARTLFSRPYGARLPSYHRLDVSVKRSFKFSSGSTFTAEVGVINVYNRKNIYYFDSDLLQRVNQTSLMPFISARIKF